MENKNNKEMALMMVKFYNLQAGTACRLGENPNRIKIITDALDRGNVADLKNWIKGYVAGTDEKDRSMMECFKRYTGLGKKAEEVPNGNEGTPAPEQAADDKAPEVETPAPAPAPAPMPTEGEVQYSMGILEQAVVGLIAKTQTERIENEIMGSVKETIRNFIQSEYGVIERKVKTVIDGKKYEPEGVVHEQFDKVVQFVAQNEPVFLTGPAGSGKNVLCKQVADALGLNFYFTNAVTQEYKLTGFTDAMGNYQPTQFYKAFTEGGVFMLDEMDASIPEVLVILNAAIANKYFDFPAPIGFVKAHPDFRIMAAGNTFGHGADMNYVGRNQLDMASLDRFAMVEVDYDERIELNVAGGDEELATFCRDFRRAAEKSGVQIVVSYRAIGRLAKMLQLLEIHDALKTCLIKGLEKDTINMICTNMKTDSKYTKAVREIVSAA